MDDRNHDEEALTVRCGAAEADRTDRVERAEPEERLRSTGRESRTEDLKATSESAARAC